MEVLFYLLLVSSAAESYCDVIRYTDQGITQLTADDDTIICVYPLPQIQAPVEVRTL